jgi:hypothetical protein
MYRLTCHLSKGRNPYAEWNIDVTDFWSEERELPMMSYHCPRFQFPAIP